MSVHSKKRRLQEIPNKYVNLLTSFERIRICQSSSAQCGHYLFTKKKNKRCVSFAAFGGVGMA